MPISLNRRAFLAAAAGTSAAAIVGHGRVFAATPVTEAYGPALVFNLPVFTPIELGFAAEEGLDLSLQLLDSGTQIRDTLASEQAQFVMTDAVNALQLQNRGKPTKILMAATKVPFVINLLVRQQLFDEGITTLEKFAEWKRPDGSKPIIGVPVVGAGAHTLGSFIFENMGVGDNVTWIGLGSPAAMLGALSSGQVDMINGNFSIVQDAKKNGWGELIFDVTDPAALSKYIGGDFINQSYFTLDSMIQSDPDLVQAYVNANYRGLQWLKTASVDDIFTKVASKHIKGGDPETIRADIEYMKGVWSFEGKITREVYEQNSKVWFRPVTGIEPMPYEDIIDEKFIDNAIKKYG